MEIPEGGTRLLTQPLQQPPPGLISRGAPRSDGGAGGAASGRGGTDGGAGDADEASAPAAVPPLWIRVDVLSARGSRSDGSGSDGSGSALSLFADLESGDEVSCSIRIRGRLADLMPECSWGMAPSAVVLTGGSGPEKEAAPLAAPAPAAAPAAGGVRRVVWLERFLVRLPSQLCEDLVAHAGDPQFLGCPIEVGQWSHRTE